jgi:hypothetical protein
MIPYHICGFNANNDESHLLNANLDYALDLLNVNDGLFLLVLSELGCHLVEKIISVCQ